MMTIINIIVIIIIVVVVVVLLVVIVIIFMWYIFFLELMACESLKNLFHIILLIGNFINGVSSCDSHVIIM